MMTSDEMKARQKAGQQLRWVPRSMTGIKGDCSSCKYRGYDCREVCPLRDLFIGDHRLSGDEAEVYGSGTYVTLPDGVVLVNK